MSALFHKVTRNYIFVVVMTFTFAMWQGLANANTAKVISVIPGVQSELDNKRTDIKLKDDIPIASTLYSDATGKARLVLPDTTCVNIAPDTELTLADFVDTEKEQNILINMVNGTAKIVTGEINRRNPDAFKITTPHASLAIRGTMAVVQVKGDATHVHLTETSGKGVVATNLATGKSVTIRKPGTMVIISPKGIEHRDSTYDELMELRGMLRHRGIGVVPTEKGRSREYETKLLPEYVASNDGVDNAFVGSVALAETTKLADVTIQPLPYFPDGLDPSLIVGYYQGGYGRSDNGAAAYNPSYYADGRQGHYWSLRFAVHADASIDTARLNFSSSIVDLRGGTGYLNTDGSFTIDGLAGANNSFAGGREHPNAHATVNGQFTSTTGGQWSATVTGMTVGTGPYHMTQSDTEVKGGEFQYSGKSNFGSDLYPTYYK